MSYEAWKRSRAEAEVPPGFADRVMARAAEPAPRVGRTGRARRVAVIAAAVVVFAYRAACALGVFFTG